MIVLNRVIIKQLLKDSKKNKQAVENLKYKELNK